ncbi:MAG: 1-acyl-sn-glycerol-3-phosphate acyltransferase [Pseudomonadota bacterium]
MTDSANMPPAPPTEPAYRIGNRVTRWIGRTILLMLGWQIVGNTPDMHKVVIIAAPHTSNWDLILALSAMMKLGMPIHFMMKKEAFFWPLGGLFKKMGGMPIDRSSSNDVTGQVVKRFEAEDTLWIAITPEGTRSKVPGYRKGYLRIAQAAGVPVYLFGVDARNKRVVLDRVLKTTGDLEADAAAHYAFVSANYNGIKPRND